MTGVGPLIAPPAVAWSRGLLLLLMLIAISEGLGRANASDPAAVALWKRKRSRL